MTFRLFATLAFVFTALNAHAGDAPGPCQGNDCNSPAPAPQPPIQGPATGFCDGVYDGFLANEPGPLTLEIKSADDCGGIEVVGNWGGATWMGRGFCRQLSPNQAEVVFQYPNTPAQRGMITVVGNGAAELDGAVDGGDSFRLMRH